MNISWSDKVSNDEVLRRVEEEKSVISTIDKRQRAWLGHTLRHGDSGRKEASWETQNGSTGQNQEWQLVPIN